MKSLLSILILCLISTTCISQVHLKAFYVGSSTLPENPLKTLTEDYQYWQKCDLVIIIDTIFNSIKILNNNNELFRVSNPKIVYDIIDGDGDKFTQIQYNAIDKRGVPCELRLHIYNYINLTLVFVIYSNFKYVYMCIALKVS